ncbi:TetR/AcrR family transcriptional regulator [Pseudonocardia eucalypti]|uniref:TetR/AcrR family transcriptional regulator n=1 Tax=Pseudonocardia eucalypti TaxID=648755 RepID=A0ABP9PQY2_9PSEU
MVEQKAQRPTAARQRRAAAREAILTATREVIAETGFPDAQVSVIAHRAGVAVGSIYQHFPSRAELFAEMYRQVAGHEYDVVKQAAADGGSASERIATAVRTFCTRALRAGRFAHTLLVEPTEPAVDEHRLAFREGYRRLFARLITDGIAEGELPTQDAEISSAAVLGIMTETLVRPLGETGPMKQPEKLVRQVVQLSLAAIGATSSPRA